MRELSKWMMLCLLILFCLVGSILIRVGIASYEQTQLVSHKLFDVRTPSGYITNKLRGHNIVEGIEVRQQEGQQILVLSEKEDGVVYERWIYCFDHKLYEAYMTAGSQLSLDLGFELMDLESLSFEQHNNDLTVRFETTKHEVYELLFQGG